MKRGEFLRVAGGGLALTTFPTAAADGAKPFPFAGEIGITAGSCLRPLVPELRAGKLRLLDLPEPLRDEFGMREMKQLRDLLRVWMRGAK